MDQLAPLLQKNKVKVINCTIWLLLFSLFQSVWTIPSMFLHSSNGALYYNHDVALGAPLQYFYYIQGDSINGGYQGIRYHPFMLNITGNTLSPEIRLPLLDPMVIKEGYYIDIIAIIVNILFWGWGLLILYKIPKKPGYILLLVAWLFLLFFITICSVMFLDVECIGEGSSCNG